MVWDLSATLWFFFNFIFLSSTICLGAGKFSVNITLNGTWANGFAQMNWHQESYPAAPCVTVVSPKLWELVIINDQTRCLWNKSGVDRKDVTTCNTGLIFPSKKLVFLKTNSLQQKFICLKRVLQRKEQESIKPFHKSFKITLEHLLKFGHPNEYYEMSRFQCSCVDLTVDC